MEFEAIIDALAEYGPAAVLVIVFLEYMNLPGFPAGVIMPLAGIWASHGKMSFFSVLVLSTIAGLAGSCVLYFLGYLIGYPLLEKWQKHFPKQKPHIDKAVAFVRRYGCRGLFISKLIPVMRTIVPIPAGIMRMDFTGYCVYSVFGIILWNTAFIGAGYYFGELVLPLILK